MLKKSNLTLFCFLAGTCLVILLSACKKDNTKTETYTIYTPIYKAKSEVLAAINGNPVQPVETAGKIYIKDNFIFLNEVDKGIHVIDNSNPAHPVQTAFIAIPGNQDIAVNGHILYADMYSDLLSIDITDPAKAKVTSLLPGFFKNRLYVNGSNPDSNQVVASWITKDTTVVVDDNYPYYRDCPNCGIFLAANANNGSKSGVAGSMAKMVLINDYLYGITEPHSIGIVNVSNAASPVEGQELYAGFDLQTIYPFDNKLFLGSAIGMFMYDVSDPANPVKLGEFSHGRACDPVITDGSYAYVTLHAGTTCGGSENEMNVIDISDLLQPQLIKTYPMTKPTGLCKDGSLLFVCDGNNVKLYNSAHPADLKLLSQIESREPYDVIAGNKRLMVVAKDGLYQYDYSNTNNIRQLSFFQVKH